MAAIIRDDRGLGLRHPPPVPTHPAPAPDAVLYDCPECGRAHLVVPACPDPDGRVEERRAVLARSWQHLI